MIRDAVLLELPVGVIRCSATEECLAAAPAYQVSDNDFNEDPDRNESKDPRWAVLDDLRFEDELRNCRHQVQWWWVRWR